MDSRPTMDTAEYRLLAIATKLEQRADKLAGDADRWQHFDVSAADRMRASVLRDVASSIREAVKET